MTIGQKTENRGGKREGAGRKPVFELSDEARIAALKDFAAIAKKYNTTLGKALGEIAFGRHKSKTLKIQAMRCVLSNLMTQTSERDVTVSKKPIEPGILLPPRRVDPAKEMSAEIVPIKKAEKK